MTSECILCGKCLEVCPLFNATQREELGPRAKADLAMMLEHKPNLLRKKDAAALAGLCLGCHRCRDACSRGMDVPALVSALREEHPDFRHWLWKQWLTHADRLWAMGSRAAKLVPEALVPEQFGPHLRMLTGLRGDRGLSPFVEVTSFPDTYRGEKMLLFAGCTATYIQGRWLMAALRLLDGLGVEVIPGDFQCCGSSLKGAGFRQEAAEIQGHNIKVWKKAGKPRIVTFCASCRAGLDEYDFTDSEEGTLWTEAQLSLSETVHDTETVILPNSPEKIGYHHPCHASGHDPDNALLSRVMHHHLVSGSGRQCCGFGGVMRLCASELTDEVNKACWDALKETGIVLSGCSACVAQLSATAPDGVSVGHWLEVIT